MVTSEQPDRTGTMVIRPYQKSDLSAVLEITASAWQPVFMNFQTILGDDLFEAAYPDWQAKKISQVEAICQERSGVTVIVAELDGDVVGFASYVLFQQVKIGEIGNNAVHPLHQNAGTATLLYNHILDAMRQAGMHCAKVVTGMDESHAPARRAYQKAGFEQGLPFVVYYQEL